jgi:hypothetical protein
MAVGDAPAVDPNLFGYPDDLPLTPASATLARPSIAEQQRLHAEQNPAPVSSDDSLPLTPTQQPGILDSSWSVAGKRLFDAGAHGVGLGTRATISGLTSLPATALDAVTWPGRAIQRAIGVPTTAPSDLIQKGLDAAGLPTPQTPTEQNVSTVVGGAASTLPTLALGGAPTVANALRLLLQGGAGALAGQKAAELDFVPAWAKPTANMAGALAGARFADVAANLGAKGVNAVAGNFNPVYAAFRRAQVDPLLAATVSGGEGSQSLEAAGARMPFASSYVRPAQQRMITQFGQSVDRTANQLDPAATAVTAQTTGNTLQDQARNWINNVFGGPQGKQETAWAPLNQRMAGAAVDPSGFRTALGDAAAPPRLASLPETQQAWGNAQARNWLESLNNDVGPNGNITWDQARAIRTRIGDAMGTPAIVEGVGAQQLRNIYGSLTDDLGNTATAHGQGALFNDANAVSTQGHSFIENTLRKIVKSNNPYQEVVDPEAATKAILNGGDTHMQAIRQEMPDAADVLAAYKLRQAQTAKPSVAGAYDDTSTGTWLSNINRMRQQTPGGYDALFGDPAVRGQLDDLQTVAQRLRATERHVNTSGTAEQLGWMNWLNTVAGHLGEGELKKAAISAASVPAAGWTVGNVLTSPALARYAGAQNAGPPFLPPRVAGLLGAAGQ